MINIDDSVEQQPLNAERTAPSSRFKTRRLPLVAAQPGIWIADQLSPFHNAFAVAHSITLPGSLNLEMMQHAIQQGLAEADTVNFRFKECEGEAYQYADPDTTFTIECIDLREDPQALATAHALMETDLQSPLRITDNGAAVRQVLMRISNEQWVWYQRYHHLMVDGFSFIALTKRISEIYAHLCQQQPLAATPFTSFDEVVEEYLAYQHSATYQKDKRYWQEKVSQLPDPLSLAQAPLNGEIASPQVIRHAIHFSSQQLAPLTQHLAETGLTPVEGAVTLVNTWLAHLTGQQPFSAGFIFMRRMGSAALSAVGPVINVLPMSVGYQPTYRFTEFASLLSKEIKKNRRHQRYDAEQISRDLGMTGDSAPLFGPVLNVKLFDYQLVFEGQEVHTTHLASGPVRDIEIALILDTQGALTLEFSANKTRYDEQALLTHIQRLPLIIEQLTAQPDLPLCELNLLSEQEQHQLTAINATEVELKDDTLWSMVAEQCRLTPENIALADTQAALSYAQMQQQVIALAATLQQQGVEAGDIVAVALPRSIYLSLALQAIVRLGAIWLPLDTGYPDDRLAIMLEDSTPRLVITEQALSERFTQISETPHYYYQSLFTNVPSLSAPLPLSTQGAYLIYTSGSTGRPKGVLVGHQAIVNRLKWMQNHYPLHQQDVVIQKTPSSFDVSVWEFFWPLMTGAKLFMAPPECHRDPEWLQQVMVDQQVSVTHFVPSMLAAFLESLTETTIATLQQRLRLVFCSGEALPTALARQWEQDVTIPCHNLYGPTEAAVDVSWFPAFGPELAAVEGHSVPIGWPVWNTQLHILDSQLKPVAYGIAGELWLGGVQLAEGYLGRPELTAERFIPAPWDTTQRLYRSGDVARRLAKGEIEYLGRNDDQLKIRGQRIELSEIDAVLLSLPGIKQAASVAVSLNQQLSGLADDRQLVSYIIVERPQETDLIRQQLAERLPAHMVPVIIIPVDAFPLSSNGKLDRKALPVPQLDDHNNTREPQGQLEIQLAALFADLLQLPHVAANQDFFALGGHSLLAMRLAAQIRKQTNYPLTVGHVMVNATVEKLAQIIQQSLEQVNSGLQTLLPLRQTQGPRLYCFHPASGFAWQFSVLQRYLDPTWSIIGIQSPDEQGALGDAQHIDDVCERHLETLLADQPTGPYYFIGYSLGGTLAQGIASRLEARGEEVAFLGLLDTWPPETQNWDEKQGKNVLDVQVIEEVNREREQFVQSQRQQAGEELSHLFDQVEANYGHSVRLLTTARSRKTRGQATLFSALKTQQPALSAQQAWAPFIQALEIVPLDCAHVEIISAPMFETIGPEINRRLMRLLG
ncbi:amino acid adenylation domain-containing protein [Rosenbergiella sp. S61]|uniref:Amino acid adenylation domain-containing protein n=1 Tax=Rosenbergiella gaditana TaxID=2726987 RepID=A0ABS5SX42_9GAMM|nr:non-ribosomal peptide synthetase [Rosenbergiella gaditana]MBT0724619.1 amino acid adenylation domain-containing protein [Rosenbergiella gaditana]